MPEKAIFLDRDDTLIEDPGYISSPEQVKLLEGASESLVALKSLGYKLIVVTNQSGVARGIVTEKTLEKIHDRMKQLLAQNNAFLDRIYYCPYHPDGVVPKYRKESNCRKPNPGMLLRAVAEMDIDLKQSWCIGNSERDVEAGVRAGCKTILIDGPSHRKKSDIPPANFNFPPDYRAVNIKEAVNIIKKYLRSPAETKVLEKPAVIIQNEPLQQVPIPSPEIQEQVIENVFLAEEMLPKHAEPAQETVIKELEPAPQPEQELESEPEPEQEPELETESETEAEPAKKPKSKVRRKIVPEMDSSTERTEQLLYNISGQLKSMQRANMFSEFSVMRLVAGIVQIMVLFCLLITVWFLLNPQEKSSSVFIALGFSVVLQLMALTFYIMHGRK